MCSVVPEPGNNLGKSGSWPSGSAASRIYHRRRWTFARLRAGSGAKTGARTGDPRNDTTATTG